MLRMTARMGQVGKGNEAMRSLRWEHAVECYGRSLGMVGKVCLDDVLLTCLSCVLECSSYSC